MTASGAFGIPQGQSGRVLSNFPLVQSVCPRASGDAEKEAEIRRLKRELLRVTEERDILKKATAYFARDAK